MISEDYHTGWYGKWHLGDDVIRQHGFDEWVSTEDGHRPEYTRREYRSTMSDYHHHLVEHGFEPDGEAADGAPMFSARKRANLPEEHQMASFLGGRAADFIDRNEGSPFMLYVSTFEPHPPYYGPLNDLYDPETLPVGPTFLKVPEGASMHNTVRARYCTQYWASRTRTWTRISLATRRRGTTLPPRRDGAGCGRDISPTLPLSTVW